MTQPIDSPAPAPAEQLYQAIMNLPCRSPPHLDNRYLAYEQGHLDALRAAADLVVSQPAERLRETYTAERSAHKSTLRVLEVTQRRVSDLQDKIAQLESQLAAAEQERDRLRRTLIRWYRADVSAFCNEEVYGEGADNAFQEMKEVARNLSLDDESSPQEKTP